MTTTMMTTVVIVAVAVAAVVVVSSSSPASCCSKARASSRPLVLPSSSHYPSRCSPRWHSLAASADVDVPESDRRRRETRRVVRRRRPSAAASSAAIVWGIGRGGGGGGSQPSEASGGGGGGGDRRDEAIRRLVERHGAGPPMPSPDGGGYDAVLLSTRTSIDDALRLANANARFLICYISKNVGSGGGGVGNDDNNAIVVPNLLSPRVVKLANRDPLAKKKGKKGAEDNGGKAKKKKGNDDDSSKSYYIWIADDDAHVESAMKRLKAKPPLPRKKGPAAAASSSTSKSKSKSKSKGTNPPILAIVCPALSISPSTGQPRITPRILAQHHCGPPPSSPESMSAWANAVRLRHLREYARLRHARTESRLTKERTEGYASSIQDDAMREAGERARREEEEREREGERMRLGRLEDRRAGLLAGLADEPPAGAAADGIVTIALRFAMPGGGSPPPGGNVARRRFVAREATVNDVFDWIDAKFGYERERLVLTTMNGSRRFVYVDVDDDCEDGGDDDDEDEKEEDEDDDEEEDGDGEEGGGEKIGRPDKNLSLEEAGFGKMVALRVTEIARDAPSSAASEDDEEE
jgi:hypothetical protein